MGDDMGSRGLNHLKLMKRLMGEAKKKRITITDLGCHKTTCIDKHGSGVRVERRTQIVNVIWVEISRASYITDARHEGKSCQELQGRGKAVSC